MMPKLLLGLTGSVATTLASKLAQDLIDADFELKIIITDKSLPFLDLKTIPPGFLRAGRDYGLLLTTKAGVEIPVYCDADEWPGHKYRKDDPIPHIDLRNWADGVLIAPLTANTLAKIANGICDNLLTSIVRAWDVAKPVVLAPAMNTLMWRSSFTQHHFKVLSEIFRLTVVPPIAKKLACGDEGEGALADIDQIVELSQYALSVGNGE